MLPILSIWGFGGRFLNSIGQCRQPCLWLLDNRSDGTSLQLGEICRHDDSGQQLAFLRDLQERLPTEATAPSALKSRCRFSQWRIHFARGNLRARSPDHHHRNRFAASGGRIGYLFRCWTRKLQLCSLGVSSIHVGQPVLRLTVFGTACPHSDGIRKFTSTLNAAVSVPIFRQKNRRPQSCQGTASQGMLLNRQPPNPAAWGFA